MRDDVLGSELAGDGRGEDGGYARPARAPERPRLRSTNNPRRLASPSESGRLPLPHEVGVEPEHGGDPLPEFTDGNFQREVLQSELPVVVDFWAETCVPCRLQEPTIRRLAAALEGRARVGRLNVYDNPTTTDYFGIRGVPHLVVVQAGEVVLELVGDHSFEQLRDRLRGVGLF